MQAHAASCKRVSLVSRTHLVEGRTVWTAILATHGEAWRGHVVKSQEKRRKRERERERERGNAVVVLHAFVGDGLVDHEWTNRTRTNSHKSC